jgi:peptide/nickel transport system permease protein
MSGSSVARGVPGEAAARLPVATGGTVPRGGSGRRLPGGRRRARAGRGDVTTPLAGVILAAIAAAVLFAPLLAPADPDALDLPAMLAGPSWAHPLGTDQLGRDHLSRLLYGGRYTLVLAGAGTVGILALGLLTGLVAGYVGGVLDLTVSAALNVLLALPSLLLTLAILGVLGPGQGGLLVALIGGGWVGHARIFRAETLALREQAHVEAAIALGAAPSRVALRHLLPGLLPTAVVLGTLDLGALLLTVSSLSFLGLGVQPPTADWGAMLNDARPFFGQAPWLVALPGLCITVVALACNLLGDGLRDGLDRRR